MYRQTPLRTMSVFWPPNLPYFLTLDAHNFPRKRAVMVLPNTIPQLTPKKFYEPAPHVREIENIQKKIPIYPPGEFLFIFKVEELVRATSISVCPLAWPSCSTHQGY